MDLYNLKSNKVKLDEVGLALVVFIHVEYESRTGETDKHVHTSD